MLGVGLVRLPRRPANIAELKERIDSGELRESRVLEFKRQFLKKNEDTAREIAGLAAAGGVLVIGVAEEPAGLCVASIDCTGARERAEQIARDIPEPRVEVESHILDDDEPGHGVLWIEVPASSEMLHQVNGTYYTRDDTQTRRMSDAEVADRMKLREDRGAPIERALDKALAREQPSAPALHGRTCIVARPIGAATTEFYQSTRTHDAWDDFAYAVQPPGGLLPPTLHRYWGQIHPHSAASGSDVLSRMSLASYRDVEFEENGAFCHLSYSLDWLDANRGGIFPVAALRACSEAISLVGAIQKCTRQRRAWDVAFSIAGVKSLHARPRGSAWMPSPFPHLIPRDAYSKSVLGVSTKRLEDDARGVVGELTERFIAECGLAFDHEWPSDGPLPWSM